MWMMQFVLLLRLKLDLYKSSGKLLKDFYVHPIDKCVCPRQYFVCIIWNIFWWLCSTFLFHLSRSSFVHFLHFRGKYLLVETFWHYSRNYLICLLPLWIIWFVLKKIWNVLAILSVCMYFELVIFSNSRCSHFLIKKEITWSCNTSKTKFFTFKLQKLFL